MSVLSQEEINALLNNSLNGKDSNDSKKISEEKLNSFERDALGEVSNISMGAAATTLSALLGKRVEITTPKVSEKRIDSLVESYPDSYVIVDVNYRQGLQGSNVLIIHSCDASVIVDLMMGGDGTEPPQELSDLHYSAVSEAMNQMMGSSSTALSQVLQRRVDISPPSIAMLGIAKHQVFNSFEETMVQISFRIVIQNLIDSEMIQVMTIGFAKEMVEDLIKGNELGDYQLKDSIREISANEESNHPAATQSTTEDKVKAKGGENTVFPVSLGQFASEEQPNGTRPNLDLILDVGLQLSVELGRTNKCIKEILELSVGAILELDKLAGEPVDILINGKMLAQGEVVVIDENFGVRVTEIISQIERVQKLK